MAAIKRTAATAAINVQSAGLNISTRYETPVRADTRSNFMAEEMFLILGAKLVASLPSNNGSEIDAIRCRRSLVAH